MKKPRNKEPVRIFQPKTLPLSCQPIHTVKLSASTKFLAFLLCRAVFEPSLRQTKVSVAGKWDFQGRDKDAENGFGGSGTPLQRQNLATKNPANSGYSRKIWKSRLAGECVVGLREVEVSRQIKALAHRCVRNCPIERHRGISMLDAPCRRRNQLTTWSKLRMEAASRLAPYQSPKLGAVMIQPTSEQDRLESANDR